MNLGFSHRNVVRHASQKSRRANQRRRLRFDCLEDRRLLSGGSLTTPGTSIAIDNSGAATTQHASPRAVAMDSAGDAVTAWADKLASGNWNLMVERYTNSSGTLTPQGAVTVASNVAAGPLEANVGSIMVARAPTNGDFVVVWATGANATKGNMWGTVATHAQLYSANGAAIGSSLLVGGSGNNAPTSVAINDSGFDVLYSKISTTRVGVNYTLTAQQYSYTSTSDSAVGKPISIAAPGTALGGPDTDSIAMDGNGNFIVAWDGSTNATTITYYIDAERFSSAGQAQGVFQVSPTANDPNKVLYSDVAMDSAGNFVVAWIYSQAKPEVNYLDARQFTSGGTPVQAQANPITVAQTQLDSNGHATSGPVEDPIGLAETGGGGFDVSWTNAAYPGMNSIDAATYGGSGNQQQFVQVTSLASGSEEYASAAVDANDDLFVVWTDAASGSNVGNVAGQFYLDPPALVAPTTTASTTSSPTGSASPSGSTTAATDAVFAAYAYPGDDDTLG